MKKNLIVKIVLLGLMFAIYFSLYTVEASSEELEPKNNIVNQEQNDKLSTKEENEEITISKKTGDVKVNETLQLTATSSKNSSITWTSSDSSIATVSSSGLVKGIKEGSVIITAKGSEASATCTIMVKANDSQKDNTWTDFNNAKFELKKDAISGAIIQISNVVPQSNSRYYMFINSNSDKPNVTSNSSDKIIDLEYNKESKTFLSNDVSNYVELNHDLYVTILEEKSYEDERIVLYGKKVEKYTEPKYSDAFHATFMTNDMNQLVMTFTHSEKNNRKMQIKVGKITDTSILQKIKNKDASGFASLLTFAKSSNTMFNKTVDADKDQIFIEYKAGKEFSNGQNVINLNGLENGAYYFLYVKADSENGKYTSPEAVTLAKAEFNKLDSGWKLFFYGSSDFEWADFGNVETNNTKEVENDHTTAKGNLPQTGVNTIMWGIVALVVVSAVTFFYIQYKKNNFKY